MERMQRENNSVENPIAADLLTHSEALLNILGGPSIVSMLHIRDQVFRQIRSTLERLCDQITTCIDSEAFQRQGTPDEIQQMRRLVREATVKLGYNRRVNAHNSVRGEMAAGPAREASSNAVRVDLAEDAVPMEMEDEVKIEATTDNWNNPNADTTIEELMEDEDQENIDNDDVEKDEVEVEVEEVDLNAIRQAYLERLRPRPDDLFLRWRNARCYICQELL